MDGKFISPPTAKTRGPPLSEYATPKVQTAHKATIIHKEKLGIAGNRRERITGSTTEGIPTAHVSPHLSMRIASGRHSASGALPFSQNEESNLRRVASTDIGQLQSDISEKNLENNVVGISPSKRWSSMQNVSAHQHQFNQQQQYHLEQDHRGMLVDTDPTLHQSVLARHSTEEGRRDQDYQYRQPSALHQSQQHQDHVFTGRGSPFISPQVTGNVTSGSYTYAGVPNAHLFKTPKVSSSHLHAERHSYGHPEISQAGYTHSSISPMSVSSEIEASHVTGSGYFSPVNSDIYSDITSWQQRHRDQLKKQQHDVLQALGSSGNHGAVNAFLDPHKVDPVREAADSIIKEKDTIIDKLRLQVLQMERQSHEMPNATDAKQGRAAMRRLNYDPEMNYRMQDLQIDLPMSRSEWDSGLTNNNSEVIMLEKKLGEREYEMQELKNSMDADRRMKQEEIKSLQDKLSSKDIDIDDWKKRYSEMKNAHDTLQKRLDAFDRYVADLPTTEQNAQRVLELKELKEEKEKAKMRVAELEKRVISAKKSIKLLHESAEKAKASYGELQQRLEDTQAENAKLNKQLSFLEGDDHRPEDDVESLKAENVRLKGQYEQARKLLEVKHKKLGIMDNKYRASILELQERLSQEEATIDGLREEIHNKDIHLKKLRASLKELNGQNEILMEKNLTLGDKLKELEQKHTGEQAKVEQKLLKELSACYTELQDLVHICIQRAEGQDPNFSVLFGAKACSPPPMADVHSEDTLQSLKYKLSHLKDLRSEIDKLRAVISNQCADDMGENQNCITQ